MPAKRLARPRLPLLTVSQIADEEIRKGESMMLERKALLALNFYKRKPFTGSDGNLRYRIEKVELPIADSEETETKLQATIWPGPFAFAKTPDEKKTTYQTAFSEEGLQDITQWINQQLPLYNQSN